MNFISHICAFSRGVLNVRSTRSHPTLAPRPQIWLMKFTGFCTVAGEDELNSTPLHSIDIFYKSTWCSRLIILLNSTYNIVIEHC
ncbi:hypothetical protein DW833_02930 [Anaerobutyricum hallii]|uniref:Uncharacterized protein n=1 Tax=Anaerobutyricum hallii TaxID=39488 RepID=A0A414B7Q3_9FIRM|nr:hypothetical protein DW833_02930 [Anaerobutyricum hallii]